MSLPTDSPPRARRILRTPWTWALFAGLYAVLLVAAMGIQEVRDIELGRGATGLDKLLHGIAFFGLGLLLSASLRLGLSRRTRLIPLGASVVLGGLYAFGHEALQTAIPAFTYNVADAYANFAGVLLAAVLVHAMPRRGYRRDPPEDQRAGLGT